MEDLIYEFGDTGLERIIHELRAAQEELREGLGLEPDAKSASQWIDRENARVINRKYG